MAKPLTRPGERYTAYYMTGEEGDVIVITSLSTLCAFPVNEYTMGRFLSNYPLFNTWKGERIKCGSISYVELEKTYGEIIAVRAGHDEVGVLDDTEWAKRLNMYTEKNA